LLQVVSLNLVSWTSLTPLSGLDGLYEGKETTDPSAK